MRLREQGSNFKGLNRQLTPYLMMDGNAKEAIKFYERSLDVKLLYSQTFGDLPENSESPLSLEMKERVAHAVLKIGGTNIWVADVFKGKPHQLGNQMNICITTNEIEKSRSIYKSLQEDGNVNVPLQETHFSPAYGIVMDNFGIAFQIFTTSTEEALNRGHEKNIQTCLQFMNVKVYDVK